MGAYLETPITAKDSHSGANKDGSVRFGHSSMQGWRKGMEDSHIAIPELAMVGSKEIGMYAVFDGHGGAEVAKYCQKHLPNAIRAVPQWRLQEWKNALCASFHSIDRELQTIEAQRELKVLIGLDPAEADAEAATIQTRNAAAASSAGDPQTQTLQQLMVMKRMLQGGRVSAGGGAEGDNRVCRLPDHPVHAGCTAVVCLKVGNTLYVVMQETPAESSAVMARPCHSHMTINQTAKLRRTEL